MSTKDGLKRSTLPNFKQIVLALGVYSIAAVLYTFPLILDLSERTTNLGLNYAVVSNASFISEQFSELSSPLEIARIFYPVGYTIHEGFLPSLLVCLLGFGKSFILGLNLSIFLSLILTGLVTYLLAYEVVGDHLGAFLAGGYFSFSAFHLANIGVYPIFHIQWLALFLFALLTFTRRGGYGYLVLLVLSFWLACLSSWYFSVFLGVLSGCYVPFLWRLNIPGKRSVMAYSSLILAGLVLIPFTPPVLLGEQGLSAGGFKFIVDGSADLLSFFLPPFFHWHLAAWIQSLQESWLGSPSLRANYLGTFSLLTALFGIAFGRIKDSSLRPYFIVVGGVAFILALGPYLVVGGVGEGGALSEEASLDKLRLPYYWLSTIFPFEVTRAASRYSVLVLLTCALFFAAGFRRIKQVFKFRWQKILLALTGVLFLGVELWPVWPMKLKEPVKLPDFYQQISESAEESSILELPLKIQSYRMLYYAAAHKKNVIGGSVDKPFKRFEGRIRRMPFLRALSLVEEGNVQATTSNDIFGVEQQYASSEAVLESLNVRWAVIHKKDEGLLSYGNYYRDEPLVDPLRRLLVPFFEQVYEDDLIIAFERKLTGTPWLWSRFGDEWGNLEDHGGYRDRPLLGTHGTFEVFSSENQLGDLLIGISVILVPERDLTIRLNGEKVYEGRFTRRKAGGDWRPISLNGLHFRKGSNILLISTPQAAKSIAEVYGGTDERKIAFLLQRFELSLPSLSEERVNKRARSGPSQD